MLNSSFSISPVVDICLASYFHYSHYSMLPGWLGSVSCDSHIHEAQSTLPCYFATVPVSEYNTYSTVLHLLMQYTCTYSMYWVYNVMTYLCCLYILGDPSVWYGRNSSMQ